MNRVAVIGSSGAGKTTFSLKLSQHLAIDVIHLDKYFWQANWTATPKEAWREKQKELLSAETWIVDGNYGGTFDIRLSQADTIIFLDYSRYLCTWRAVNRTLRYYKRKRPDMAEGCHERFDFAFLNYVWMFPIKSKPKLLAALEKQKDKTIIILNSDLKAETFLKTL